MKTPLAQRKRGCTRTKNRTGASKTRLVPRGRHCGSLSGGGLGLEEPAI